MPHLLALKGVQPAQQCQDKHRAYAQAISNSFTGRECQDKHPAHA